MEDEEVACAATWIGGPGGAVHVEEGKRRRKAG